VFASVVGEETSVVPQRRSGKDTLPELMLRVEAEFGEMPGLSVTLPQAQRLWGMDYATCLAVFRVLTDRGVVRRTPRGQYIRV
jgi:hypothetical protein